MRDPSSADTDSFPEKATPQSTPNQAPMSCRSFSLVFLAASSS